MLVPTQRLLGKQESGTPLADDVRLVAVNIGVRSREELDRAARFWETVFETTLEDWEGHGLSRQARVGRDAHFSFCCPAHTGRRSGSGRSRGHTRRRLSPSGSRCPAGGYCLA